MRIGIEAQRIFRSKKHGMDIVALELIKALQLIDEKNEYFIFVKKGEDHTCIAKKRNFKIIEIPGISYADWEQIFLPIYIKQYELDILHCTSNTAPIFCSVPTIITLHDVIFLRNVKGEKSIFNLYQQLGKIYRKLIVPISIRKTQHVITVSNYEKKQIQSVLNITNNKISVIYNSFGTHFQLPCDESVLTSTLQKYNLPKEYVFYIGNTDPKKNMFNTMKAFGKYAGSSTEPLPLVIADVNEQILEQVIKAAGVSQYRHLIHLTGYIQNTDLPLIYAGAKVFLYPSIRESFGIPLLESMACGTPVITSDTSALPEIAGNAAYIVNPLDENEISMAIHSSLNDDEKRTEIIKNGLENIKKFNWSISAKNLLHLYQTI